MVDQDIGDTVNVENAPEPQFKVVVNDEEQYSIWPEGRDIPNGWQEVGVSGSKDVCLSHIEQVWTDMRPLSLRREMDGDDRGRA